MANYRPVQCINVPCINQRMKLKSLALTPVIDETNSTKPSGDVMGDVDGCRVILLRNQVNKIVTGERVTATCAKKRYDSPEFVLLFKKFVSYTCTCTFTWL